MLSRLFHIFMIFTSLCSFAIAANRDQCTLRLPRDVLPKQYSLSFEPDFKHFTFAGHESILLTILSKTDSITLNGLGLTIEKASVQDSGSLKTASAQPATVTYDAKNETIQFQFKTSLKPGKYILKSTFTGVLNNQLSGFYRSSHVDTQGKTHWLATTQLEPADARRMFPCFDEPDFKATFQVTAIVDPQLVALSNTPVLSETNEHGKKTILFEKTPLMSSYLLALIIGEFKRTGTKIDSNGIPISVWAVPGKENLGQVALDMASEILPEEARYFGIPYPGKKLDLIAIPDFSAGAMENLGAITFREEYLLSDAKIGTTFVKREIASVEAHEIAHQWFGDLVTMKWWDDIWLNESFATWMATKTIASLRPQWRFLERAIEEADIAKEVDQLQTTRAIHVPVLNPSQAIEMFDPITYEKGAALLRMLEYFVGEKTFQQGIHAYLTKYAFGNATTEDLWSAIALASADKIPVLAIMNSWIYQPGFPVISTALKQGGKAITLKQKRFFEAADAKETQQQWLVPVEFNLFAKKTATSNNLLFSVPDVTHRFQMPQASVFANKGGVGFYRVNYSQAEFDVLARQFATLSPEEKLIFLSDTTALAIADKTPVENALNLMLNIQDETDPLVQLALVRNFYLPIRSIDASSKTAYERLIQTYLHPIKQRLGWKDKIGEPELNKDLRDKVLVLLGTYGQDKATIDEAFNLFHQYFQNHHAINQDIVPAIVKIVAFNGGEKEYQTLYKAWKSTTNIEEEKRFQRALTDFNTPALIAKTLDLSLSSDVRVQDGIMMLSTLLYRQESQMQAWQFTKSHWKTILSHFPEVELKNIVAACNTFYTRSAEEDLQLFFAKNKIPYASLKVARTLEQVHINVLFQELSAAKIRAWYIHHIN